MSLPLPRTTLVRQFDTCRLVPSRFAAREDSVLTGIADDDPHLADLFELDNATNARLRGEHGLLPGIGIDELVFGVPNASLINAAFTHDIRKDPRFARCLDPASYGASQRLAGRLMDKGAVGVIYPSARRARGTNLACFRPAVVANVRRGDAYRFTWSGHPSPKIDVEKPATRRTTRRDS